MAKRGVGWPKQAAGSKTKEQVSKTPGAEQEPQTLSSVVGTTWAPFEPNNDAGPPMLPNGPGYMPLTSAAHWIASKGGTVSTGNDEQLWRPAFDDLLGRITSREVEVIGRRGAGNESVPGHLFARIQVAYPYSDLLVRTLLGDNAYLDCYPFVDDDQWQRESSDKLYASGRGEPQWTHLQVRKPDIVRFWPFKPSAISVMTTAATEIEAVAFLAGKFRSSGEELTRANAFAECSKYFKLSRTGFRLRVWPKARESAGLLATAPSGRKRRRLPEKR
jgi:hypothetical protein